MSIYMGVSRWDDASIDCPNPGHGELDVYLPGRDGNADVDVKLLGRDLGLVLEQLTELATRGITDPGSTTIHRLGQVSVAAARLLLPVLQRAVIYAAAGGNVAEVLLDDDDSGDFTWCTVCGEGAVYVTQECRTPQHPDGACARTAWCDEYGHTPFAGRTMPAATR